MFHNKPLHIFLAKLHYMKDMKMALELFGVLFALLKGSDLQRKSKEESWCSGSDI